MLHEQRRVDDLSAGGGGARWCCFPSCDRRTAHATEHLFRGRAAIAARPCRCCRSTGRCPFIAVAVARARACRYCRSTGRCPFIAAAVACARACGYWCSTGRCPYIAAAAAECIAISRVCDAAACIVIECRRDAAAWNDRRRIAGLL